MPQSSSLSLRSTRASQGAWFILIFMIFMLIISSLVIVFSS
ncbi:MAG: hypothetical protein ACFFCS_05170 [Candidatus Hodarchaeota archaeon]